MENYEFSISSQDCQYCLHYYAKFGGISHQLFIDLYQTAGMNLGETSKLLSKKEVIFGLNKIIKIIECRKSHLYRIHKLKRFLEAAVYPAEDSDMFYLHINY